ncbi:hypothetical protein [Carnobacterium sp. ISL-102]|uniref:hypothetical protein n=1 Tax=Carnobacterium sp. ISL-102 TaxID=2819142 RepID=UPI001BE8161D|nr:hypothetical protein [Carnobacterium sp. ISL-102]MBT2732091.1 hypothetical protein [Carnobacterium sp. ISL-102]
MNMQIIKKLIIASNMYFWGTEEVDEVSKFWYGLFALGSLFSLVILILVWLI